jgi:hypothetical protein
MRGSGSVTKEIKQYGNSALAIGFASYSGCIDGQFHISIARADPDA